MNNCHQREKNRIDSIRDFKIAMKFKELEGLVYEKKHKATVDERRTKRFKNFFIQRKKS
jgi:hypothetical protein